MGVNRAHHRLDRRFGLHRRHSFRDQLVSLGPNNMDAQDLAEFLVGHHFYKPLVTAENAGLTVRGEGKLPDLHGVTLRPRLSFRHSDTSDSRLGVRASWNSVAINRLGGLAGHVRDRDHALHRGDVGELRRTRDYIADRVNTGLAGPLKFIDLDEFPVEHYLAAFQTDILRVRLAAHGHQQRLGLHILALAIRQRHTHPNAVVGLGDVLGFRAGFASNAGLLEIALQFFRNVFVLDGHDP